MWYDNRRKGLIDAIRSIIAFIILSLLIIAAAIPVFGISAGAAQTEESVGSTLNNIKISGTPAAFAGQKATDHPPRGEASYNTVDGIAYSLWAT